MILAITLAAAASAPPQKFSPERFKAHVTFLADDLLEGREAGYRGHEIAARYVASQFALMGVKPGGENGTYLRAGGIRRSVDERTAASPGRQRAGGCAHLSTG